MVFFFLVFVFFFFFFCFALCIFFLSFEKYYVKSLIDLIVITSVHVSLFVCFVKFISKI